MGVYSYEGKHLEKRCSSPRINSQCATDGIAV